MAVQQQPLTALVAEELTQQLRGAGFFALVMEPEKVATQLLVVIAERLRQEIGPRDCSCGGCDACVQHALVDRLDPG